MATWRTDVATWTTTAGDKTATITTAAGDLLVVVVAATGLAASVLAVTDDQGGVYSKVTTGLGPTSSDAFGVFVRNTLVVTGTSTIVTTTQTSSTGGGLDVIAISGMSRRAIAAIRCTGQQETIAAATPGPVLSRTPLTGNMILSAVFNGTNTGGVTAPSGGYTRRQDLGYATPPSGLDTATVDSGITNATITWGGASASAFSSVAVEVDASAEDIYYKPISQFPHGPRRQPRIGPLVLGQQTSQTGPAPDPNVRNIDSPLSQARLNVMRRIGKGPPILQRQTGPTWPQPLFTSPPLIGPTGTLFAPTALQLTWLNNAEGGTNGVTVSAGNSGAASGNAFDAVSIGAGSTFTFDNTHTAHGSLAYAFDQGNNVVDYGEWTTTVGTRTELYFRFYIYVTANPLATQTLVKFSTGATAGSGVRLTTTRKLQVIDSTNTSILPTFTNVVPTNQWARVEGHLLFSATVGTAELKLFTGMDAPTETEVQSASGLNLSASVTTYRVGSAAAANADLIAFWLDDIGLQQGGYLGPVSPTVYPPLLSNIAQLFAPATVLKPSAAFIGPTGTTYAPTKTTLTVKPALIGPTGTLYGPTIQQIIVRNNAESGSDGTTVTTGNSGNAANNAWDTVTIGAASILTYESAHAAHGGLAIAIDAADSVTDYVSWSTTHGTITNVYGRCYLYSPSPGNTTNLITFLNGASQSARIRYTTTRKLQLMDASNTQLGAIATAFTVNSWVRIEWHIFNDPTNGIIEVKLFNTPDSGTLTDSTLLTGVNTGTQTTVSRFGSTTGVTPDLAKFWLDDIVVSTTGYPGPAALLPPLIGPTGTLYAPTVNTVRVYAPVIGPTNTRFAPSKVTLTVKPSLIGPTGTLFAPLVKTVKVYAPVIGPTGTLYAPSTKFTEKPGLIGPTEVLYAPSKVILTVKPGLIGPTNTLYAPTKVQLIVLAPLKGPTGTLFAPTVKTVRVYAPLIGPTNTLYAPTEVLKVAPGFIGPTGTLFAPSVKTVRVYAPVIGPTGTLYTPSKVTLTVKPAFIGPTSVLYAPTRVYIAKVFAPFIGPTGVTYAPREILKVSPGFIGPTGTLFAPAVSTVRVYAPAIGPTDVLYAATKVTLTVKPGLIGPTSVLYGPTIKLIVKPGFIGPTNTLYSPSVSITSSVLTAPVIGPTNLLFAPTQVTLRVFAPLVGPTGTLFSPVAAVTTIKLLTDVEGLTDTRLESFTRPLTDTAPASDAILRSLARVLTEPDGIPRWWTEEEEEGFDPYGPDPDIENWDQWWNEFGTIRDYSSVSLTRAITDSEDETDSRLSSVTRLLTDAESLTDSLLRSLTRLLTDPGALTDDQLRSFTRALTDVEGLTDTQLTQISRIVTSGLEALIDSRFISLTRAITDAEDLTDAETHVNSATTSVEFTDAMGLTDIEFISLARLLTDTESLTDSAAKVISSERDFTDAEGLTDIAKNNTTRPITDAADLTDLSQRTVAKSLTDSNSLTDSQTQVKIRTILELLGLTDSRTFNSTRTLMDTLHFFDDAAMRRNTFEQGIFGDTLTTVNSGGPGVEPFDTIVIGGASTLTFDNTHTRGSLSLLASNHSTNAVTYIQWGVPALTEGWVRAYVYMENLPGIAQSFIRLLNSNSTVSRFGLTSAGKMQIFDSVGASRTGTTTVPTGQWVRFEFHTITDATDGFVEVQYYSSADSLSPDEILQYTSANTASSFNQIRYGLTNATACQPVWFEDIAFSSEGWLGPVISGHALRTLMRPLTELESLSDFRQDIIATNMTDALDMTDDAFLTILKEFVDEELINDTFNFIQNVFLTLTDVEAMTDRILRDFSRIVSDSEGLTDLAQRIVTYSRAMTDSSVLIDSQNHILTRALTDAENSSDSRTSSLTRALQDAAGLSDSRLLSITHIFADTCGMSDARLLSLLRGLIDAEGLTDFEFSVFEGTLTQYFTDNAGSTDALLRELDRIVTESTSLSDIRLSQLQRLLAPNASSLTDALRESVTRNVADSEALTDSYQRSLARTIVNSGAFTDLTHISNGLTLQLIDSEDLLDIRMLTLNRLMLDSAQMTDAYQDIIMRLLVESTPLQDSRTRQFARIIAETILMSDTASKVLLRRLSPDTIAMTDVLARIVAFVRIFTDGTDLADVMTTDRQSFRNFNDDIVLSDLIIRTAHLFNEIFAREHNVPVAQEGTVERNNPTSVYTGSHPGIASETTKPRPAPASSGTQKRNL